MTEALQITDLSKSFGSSVALRGVSFVIPTGSLYGLVGPSGPHTKNHSGIGGREHGRD